MEGRVINIRKLVSLDIVLHGPRFILIEFGIGTPAILLFGVYLYENGDPFFLGLYLLLTGVNYVPLLAYAILVTKDGSAKQEVEAGLAHNTHYVRRYSIQQGLIFLPFAIVLLAIWQEWMGTRIGRA